ncbi:ribokinase [Leifsonia poae]|uniref:ribokinase n=1 Tax=Leifsonia poae TaxID=110933 RepID=UPI003D67FCA6
MLATGSDSAPGGKGNNQVTAVARAGALASFIAALGTDDAAHRLIASLSQAGVELLLRRVDAPTGTALITVDDHAENAIVVDSGANRMLVDLTEAESEAIGAADILLLQLETPVETVTAAATIARAAGTTVVLNAAPIRALPEALLGVVDVLIVNEHEAAQLAADLGGGLPEDADEQALAEALSSLGLAVIITLGARGALVCVPGEPPAHVAGLRVDAVDTTGAGDTFCGALVADLDRNASTRASASSTNGNVTGGSVPDLDVLVKAAEFATVAAALSVQRAGAVPSIPTLEEIRHFRPTR